MTNPTRTPQPQILHQTPWVTLVAIPTGSSHPHYALQSKDYVSVVAIAPDHGILLVRQFRPVAGQETIELPAGHVEGGQDPKDAAITELLEETGYTAQSMDLLGVINPDTGRLLIKHWCYFASGLTRVNQSNHPDEVAKPFTLPLDQFYNLITDGSFKHAQHIAPILLAILKGKLPPPPPSRLCPNGAINDSPG